MSDQEAVLEALAAEYADVVGRRGVWAERHFLRRAGAKEALGRVAEALGVPDLAARAAAKEQAESATPP